MKGRTLLFLSGSRILAVQLEDGLPLKEWYWIGGRMMRVHEVRRD